MQHTSLYQRCLSSSAESKVINMWLQNVLLFMMVTNGWALSTSEIKIFEDFNVTLTTEQENNVYVLHFVTLAVPNHAHNHTDPAKPVIFQIPKTAKFLPSPGCVPQKFIGVAVNGIPFAGPYSLNGTNSVEGPDAHAFDNCSGFADKYGHYMYQKQPDCLIKHLFQNSSETEVIVGVALDGFPIYATANGSGVQGLDECNGKRGSDAYNYRYYLTDSFPYTLGCFVGQIYLPKDAAKHYIPSDLDCFYANVTYPEGIHNLTVGKLNNGADIFGSDETDIDSNKNSSDSGKTSGTGAASELVPSAKYLVVSILLLMSLQCFAHNAIS